MDQDKIKPPQWLGRPIVSPEHAQDLETRAAVNEFHNKMPRHQAEEKAHQDYVKDQRERAAAHHLQGLKAAQATGNHEDARKHYAMYDLHLKALGKEAIGAVPPEIEKRMSEEDGKPVYKFKAHKGDLYALRDPEMAVAQPGGDQQMAKAEDSERTVHKFMPRTRSPVADCRVCGKEQSHKNHTKDPAVETWETRARRDQEGVKKADDWERQAEKANCNCQYFRQLSVTPEHLKSRVEHKRSCPAYKGPDKTDPIARSHGVKKDEDLGKGEAKQCKWRLGERRCKRMVTSDYCHDHVDHWANKIKTREGAQEVAKDVLKSLAETFKKAALPPGTSSLQAPPSGFHDNVEGFMGGLKALPKGSPLRGTYITRHMNHAPFLQALAAHPQGTQIKQMLNQHLNGANAVMKPGQTVTTAK